MYKVLRENKKKPRGRLAFGFAGLGFISEIL
jgi:hypothetical protein